jgi:NADH-quinone oxidoreductase subunit N
MNDLLSLLPLLITCCGALALMLVAAFERLRPEGGAYLSMLFLGLAFLAQLTTVCDPARIIFRDLFNGMAATSPFTATAGLIILACALATVMVTHTYFKTNPYSTTEFYAVLLFAVCGTLLLTLSHELISAFIALEIMSLAIYILVGFNRGDLKAAEAVLKYLILGAFAGAFFTMGTALLYGAVASTKFLDIAVFCSAGGAASPLMIGGVFLILVALLFKVAAFPFHAWVVDVYDGAAVPVTGFMATALKTAIFTLFANLLAQSAGLHQQWITFLYAVAVLTMFGGNLIAIGQNNLKRMLAASGIVHSGYLLIALIAIDADHFSGSIIAYYLAAYGAGTLGIFAALSYLGGSGEQRMTFDQFRGLAKVRPLSAAAITVFLLSMAGIPPTAGFMGKFYVITGAISAGQTALAVLGIISSILSMWYYLRLIVNMYFHEAEEGFHGEEPGLAGTCTVLLAVCVFAIGLYPIII